MATTTIARAPYSKRDVPQSYDHGWWVVELGNIQRAIPLNTIKRVTTLYTPTANDHTILCDCTTAAVVIGLPPPNREQALQLMIKKIAGSPPVTILGTVDGVVDPTLPNVYDSIMIVSDGTEWLKIGGTP